jgi:hypothetical protein
MTNPIYIVEGQLYRFEQIIDGVIELFNSKLQKSVLVNTSEIEDVEEEIAKHNYVILEYEN